MAGERRRLIARGAVALAGLACLGAAAPAPAPSAVDVLAGRYSRHFKNGMVDGETYWSDDVVEVVPVDPAHAYVRIALNFYNGHECNLSVIATATGNSLDYREPAAIAGRDGETPCHMTVSHDGPALRFDDHDGSCQSTCGSRGGYAGGGLPWSSRRPITYLARLRGSGEYQTAIREWQGKP